MGTFARAVITGFGFSLGKMIFDKVRERVENRMNGQGAGAADGFVDLSDDHDG